MACLRYDVQARGIVLARTPVPPTTRLPMPDLAFLFPVIVAAHVCVALALLVPSLLLPFTLQARERGVDRGRSVGPAANRVGSFAPSCSSGPTARWSSGRSWGLIGLAMVLVLGPRILEQPWLLTALATCAVTLGMAFFPQRPELPRLLGRGGEMRPEDPGRWLARARRRRSFVSAITTVVGSWPSR